METNARYSRRQFLGKSASAAAGLLILGNSRSARAYAANGRLAIALVGVGGRGKWFVDSIPGFGGNLVALCDVNDEKAAEAYAEFPDLPKFQDYRRMLDEMGKGIEAVIVALPDHSHAPCAALAMKAGKHVYCEKPLTRCVREARALRDIARQRGVATQMGNQGTASPPFRRALSLIRAGAIGEVREVLVWNDGSGAGRHGPPHDSEPIPETLEWDLWLGPARWRPYHPEWMKWHAWRDFGTGQLGNWASHSANLAFMALEFASLWYVGPGEPPRIRVEAEKDQINPVSFPRWERVFFAVPARGDLPPVTLKWFNGPTPDGRPYIEERLGRRLDWGDAGEKKWADHAGALILGSRGAIHATGHNATFSLLPQGEIEDPGDGIPESLPTSPGHEREWILACKGGAPAVSCFDYAVPLTEFLLLGNVATRFEGPLEFDPVRCRVVNNSDADAALGFEYRKGWSL